MGEELVAASGSISGSLPSLPPMRIGGSEAVKDLVAGSGLTFEDRGEHELKGVPDRWHRKLPAQGAGEGGDDRSRRLVGVKDSTGANRQAFDRR